MGTTTNLQPGAVPPPVKTLRSFRNELIRAFTAYVDRSIERSEADASFTGLTPTGVKSEIVFEFPNGFKVEMKPFLDLTREVNPQLEPPKAVVGDETPVITPASA